MANGKHKKDLLTHLTHPNKNQAPKDLKPKRVFASERSERGNLVPIAARVIISASRRISYVSKNNFNDL